MLYEHLPHHIHALMTVGGERQTVAQFQSSFAKILRSYPTLNKVLAAPSLSSNTTTISTLVAPALLHPPTPLAFPAQQLCAFCSRPQKAVNSSRPSKYFCNGQSPIPGFIPVGITTSSVWSPSTMTSPTIISCCLTLDSWITTFPSRMSFCS